MFTNEILDLWSRPVVEGSESRIQGSGFRVGVSGDELVKCAVVGGENAV